MIALPYGLPDLPDQPSADDVGGVLAQIDGLSWDRSAWADFLAAPRDVQVRNLRVLAASAQNPGPDWAAKVIAVGKAVLIVAGAVTGLAGAISGVQSIKW